MLHSLKAMRLAVLRAERLAGVRLLPLRRTFNRLLAGGPPLIVLDEEDGMTFDNPVEIDSEDEAPPAKKARTEKKKKKHKKDKGKETTPGAVLGGVAGDDFHWEMAPAPSKKEEEKAALVLTH